MTKNTQSKEITFWNLLKDNKIEIPIIQRDYAQGRIGKEYLRKTFLESLKSELDLALNNVDNEEKLKLDFVYGISENGKIYPLDGQQRLTTLWLLHWYVVLRSGELTQEICKKLSNFTYETRITSREFCKQLCNVENWKNYTWSGNISEYIKDQSWFSSAWLQDPTISSMLNMLAGTKPTDEEKEDISDGIEEIFKDIKPELFKKYWTKLTGDKCPIVFYYLPITDMGLTDDLYIKMNARGKQLSSFENLKADLLGYVQKQANTDNQWKKFLTIKDEDGKNYLPSLLDTEWTDLFWDYKGRKEENSPYKIDEIFFTFINRFFWNEVVLDNTALQSPKKLDDNKNYKYFNNSIDTHFFDTTIVYHGLSIYKYKKTQKDEYEIPIDFFDKLIKVIGNYLSLRDIIGKNKENESKEHDILDKLLFSPFEKNEGNDKQFYFIPNYLANINTYKKESKTKDNVIYDNDRNEVLAITHLTQVQRVVFSAVCKFFLDCEEMDDNSPKKLQQWMRVVWNLVSGLDEKGRPQIRTVDTMLKAIKFINNEKLKSHDIYNSLSKLTEINGSDNFYARCLEECIKSKKILDDNENNFSEIEKTFRGSIRFLFTDENGQIDWNNYSTKSKSALEICKDYNKALQKLIKYCNSTEQLKHIIYEGSELVMITNLLNKNLVIPVHRLLMEQIPTEQSSLQEHILDNIKQLNGHKLKIDTTNNQYYLALPYKSKNDERIDLDVYDVIENTKA